MTTPMQGKVYNPNAKSSHFSHS